MAVEQDRWEVESTSDDPEGIISATRTGLRMRVGVALSAGSKDLQQDKMALTLDANAAQESSSAPARPFSCAAVADGHALRGGRVADYVTDFLADKIRTVLAAEGAATEASLASAFASLDEDILRELEDRDDVDFRDVGGAVATAVFCVDETLYGTNVGDARALFLRRVGDTKVSVDHQASLPSEQQRIREAGGEVMEERLVCPGGLLLEPSRSMADFHAKQTDPPLVATQPCLIQEPVDNILAFVCASDGLWGPCSNQFVERRVRESLGRGETLEAIATGLAEEANHRRGVSGSRDNVVVVVGTVSEP